jgi:hypothetical protein
MSSVARNCPHCGRDLPGATPSGAPPAGCPHCGKPLPGRASPETIQPPPVPQPPSQGSGPQIELTLDDVVTPRPPASHVPAALAPAHAAPPRESYLSEADLTCRPVSRPGPAEGFWAWAVDFLLFREQVATLLIPVAWLLTWCATIVAALYHADLASQIPGTSPLLQTAAYWAGVALVLVLQRVVFEQLAVVLLINDTSTELMRLVERLPGGPGAGTPESGRAFWDLLTLRSFLFVPLTVVVWVGGTAALVFSPFVDLGVRSALLRGLLAIAAVVLWRIICEEFVVLFRIGQTLAALHRDDDASPEEDPVQRFFSFRALIMPSLVRLVWYAAIVGAALAVATPWVPVHRFLPRGAGLAAAIGALVVVRLACEMSIVVFGIHESLWALRRTLAQAYPDGASTAHRQPGYLFFRRFVLRGLIAAVWLLGSLVIAVSPAFAPWAMGRGGAQPWSDTLPYTIPLALGALVVFRLNCEQLLLVFLLNEAAGESVSVVSALHAAGKPARRCCGLDFLRFRALWAPHVIQVIWILALLGFFFTALWCINASLTEMKDKPGVPLTAFLIDIGALIASRFVCELAIVVFSLYGNLRLVCDRLGAPGPLKSV